MSKIFADFHKLSGSVINLNIMSKIHDPELYDSLHSNRDKIIEIGDSHDNCFSSINTISIEKSIENTSNKISDLSSKVDDAMESIYLYSISDSDMLTLFDKEYNITSASLNNQWDYIYLRFYRDDLHLSDKISHSQITANYDAEYYNKILSSILNDSNSQRDKVVNSAIFMSCMFPHLPYFWGGGHYYNYEGVDPTWGTDKLVTAPGHSTSGTYIPYSMDCAGYVDWLFYNSGVSTDRCDCTSLVGDYVGMGTYESITADGVASRTRPGDLVEMDGHVGVVVSTNGNTITVSHCSGSGSGLNLTSINTETGLVEDDSSLESRVKDQYFTSVIHINYDDDVDPDEEKNDNKEKE